MSERADIDFYVGSTDNDSFESTTLDSQDPAQAVLLFVDYEDEKPALVYVHGCRRTPYEMTPSSAAVTLVCAIEDVIDEGNFCDDSERHEAHKELTRFFEAHIDVLKRISSLVDGVVYEIVTTEEWVLVDGEYRRGTP